MVPAPRSLQQPDTPFSIKEIWMLTWVRWFFGTLVHYLLSLLTFWIKLLFLPLWPHLLIYWPVVLQAIWLDSVTLLITGGKNHQRWGVKAERNLYQETLLRLLSSPFILTSAAIHGVAKSRTRLSDWTDTLAIFPQLLLFVQPSMSTLAYWFLGGLICPQENLYNFLLSICLQSVQFSRSVVSDSWRSHGLPHARPPCPSPSPGAYSNSCP